ncbi:hypothetical protein PEDI_37680 [Persicobacter diffluens]|uniref:DUF4935 domain-containing protein n=2 Tax=Persicobacter diffluens TaxID=981 RepID=A0AAN4W031_9BACT|nr:hypothetical protein PEDI_37680 [Persicobacter diffluens]
MNIVIDTSILRKDRGFLNSDILLLKKLSKLELLKIHFPWVVYKESTSHNFKDIDSVIGKAIKEITSLNRKGISNEVYVELEEVAKKLDSIKSTIDKSVDKHWTDFINDTGAILHEINNEHGKLVMSSYFGGDKPFPEPKSRKDIPDAFIYEAIKSIIESVGNVYFICADNNLRNVVNDLGSSFAFASYADFYKSSDYKAIEDEYKKIEHYSDELILLKENTGKISEFAISEIYGDVFAGNDQEIFHESLPSDDNIGMLQDMDNVTVNKIHLDEIQFIDGVFYIPINISATFGIEYFMFKSDYYMEAEGRNISIIDDDWNKHYFLIYENFNVKLSYQCSIEQDSIKQDEFEFDTEQVVIDELIIIEK